MNKGDKMKGTRGEGKLHYQNELVGVVKGFGA